MKKVGAYHAKTHFSSLLDEVAQGESVVITKHSVPVAVLKPIAKIDKRISADAVEAIRAFRKGKRLGDMPIKSLIDTGRR